MMYSTVELVEKAHFSSTVVPNGATLIIRKSPKDSLEVIKEYSRPFRENENSNDTETVYDAYIHALNSLKPLDYPHTEERILYLTHLPTQDGLRYIHSRGIQEIHFIFSPDNSINLSEFRYEPHREVQFLYNRILNKRGIV